MVDVAVDNNLSTPFCGQTSQHFDMQAYPVSLTHATMEVVLKPTIRTNMHICVPVLILCPILGLIWVLSSYISSATGVILVYTQCATWVYPRRTPAAWVYPRRTPVSILVWDTVSIWAGIIKYLLRPHYGVCIPQLGEPWLVVQTVSHCMRMLDKIFIY